MYGTYHELPRETRWRNQAACNLDSEDVNSALSCKPSPTFKTLYDIFSTAKPRLLTRLLDVQHLAENIRVYGARPSWVQALHAAQILLLGPAVARCPTGEWYYLRPWRLALKAGRHRNRRYIRQQERDIPSQQVRRWRPVVTFVVLAIMDVDKQT